jgi:hypothetical protein
MSPVSDLEVYQRLVTAADEFERLQTQGVSFVGSAALNTACRALRGMAQAIYEHSLSEPDEEATPQ